MATSSRLKDIGDKFCRCSVCLENLKGPKQLPCLHRYCKDCLISIIQVTKDVIKCPECREEIQIPTNGVDGFKTDFNSKSLVEYVQSQQSLKSVEVRGCYGCSRHPSLIVTAYCFKCNDFLCKDCHNFHITNETLKGHQKHTLSLEDIGAHNITIEKLASMRDAPRCYIHLQEIAKLYCETCGNLPVCTTCTYGEHKGHNLYEITGLAKLKREELTQKINALEANNRPKDKNVKTSKQSIEKLSLNVNIEREKIINMHYQKDKKIMTKIQDIEERIQKVEKEKQNTEKNIFVSLQTEMEHEIDEVKKKYEDIFRVKKLELNDTFEGQESSLKEELAKLREKRECFDQDKKELLTSIETQLNENVKIIEEMSEHYDNIKKRFETLNVMASSILASDNDWSAVQCIPDMCTAATNLMKDLKKFFPELTSLTNVTVNHKHYSLGKPNFTKISDNFIKKISINHPYRYVFGVTNSGDGNIIVSGMLFDTKASFIIVIDMNGRILMGKKLNARKFWPRRYCKSLSQHKVASVCKPDEIGLYDVRDDSYNKKNISDVINSWPKDRCVSCVTTDPVNNHILVGGYKSRYVYVFDDQLNYLHTLTLPEMIKWPRDITVCDGHLLVCDYDGRKCYVTTMDGLRSKLVGQFMKPNLEGNCFGPISVCSDMNGFLYVLWKNFFQNPSQCCLVQYNHNGSQVLTARELEGDARVVTVVETSQGEKLLVGTHDTQTVYCYDLLTED
ncbi:E3 ubiquitin-protein ligase TRIM56 [Holothuria leucospilota]|uniref:E3 ubiquitin-protein ligase TRIM56 n=1 Tax=Holothuria leucospilota TaxID=206669 RepID=A0A9Q1BT64_HOLLE|nr:E3 ubiquitin-protein ligase TRIM56 [Holothuria leucospilota]